MKSLLEYALTLLTLTPQGTGEPTLNRDINVPVCLFRKDSHLLL